MAAIPGIPQNFVVQTGNQQILVSWAQTSGATSYVIQRSLDNVTFTTLATVSGSPLASSYVDTSVILGTNYWYQVSAANSNGQSSYTQSQSATPTPVAEMTLGQIRLQAQQRADRVNSQFLTTQEWNQNINKAMFELYDLLITVYEDYFVAPPIQFVCDGVTYLYPLPNGSNSFLNANNTSVVFVPQSFYKLLGVDLALNNATNAYVTVNKFQFAARNRFVYPNTSSTLYGVFNMQYRIMGTNIEFIPTPSAGQAIRLWYIPRLQELLSDTDITTIGFSGWLDYVIVRAAIYALAKEESDTSGLERQLLFLKSRIEETASNRDASIPDTVSDVRSNWNSGYGGQGSGFNGASGGFSATPLLPLFFAYNQANHGLANSVNFAQSSLAYVFFFVTFSYFLYSNIGQLRGRIIFSRVGNFISHCTSTFFVHVRHVIGLGSKKKMSRVDAPRIVTSMTNTQPFFNLAFKKFVRNSASNKPFRSNRKSASFFVAAKTSIPFPALVKRNELDFAHKSFFNIHKEILPWSKQ